jgi:hypothetical protein
MGMPSRLHGKMVPLAPGKTETCPYCLRQYKYVRVVERSGKTEKLCPFCERVLSGLQGFQARIKSVIKKATTKGKPKKRSEARKSVRTTRSKKK